MGFLMFVAFSLVGIALVIRHWDSIKAQFKPETYEPPKQVTERRLEDPISVDEFFTFRWNIHRCPDVVLRQEMEGGAECDYCGSFGVGSF